ncbi:hypothetical protein VNO78_27630 [Psophocarpus tetragonolobus]|uniref:Uncharacterized protein n=1 Tax=Psophocarpus tetragonolobus TaxID=3891 RepID=A0AAN9S0S0_PSOTE
MVKRKSLKFERKGKNKVRKAVHVGSSNKVQETSQPHRSCVLSKLVCTLLPPLNRFRDSNADVFHVSGVQTQEGGIGWIWCGRVHLLGLWSTVMVSMPPLPKAEMTLRSFALSTRLTSIQFVFLFSLSLI